MSLMIESWMQWRSLLSLVVIEVLMASNAMRKTITSPEGIALACDPCTSGSLIAHPRALEQSMPLPTIAMSKQ